MEEKNLSQEESNYKIKKNKLENELLQLDIDNYNKKNQFSYKRTSLIIGFIVVLISISQVIVSLINADTELEINEKEFDRRYSLDSTEFDRRYRSDMLEKKNRYDLDISEFIMKHKNDIFSDNFAKRNIIKNVMIITFPKGITDFLFEKIEKTAKKEEVKRFWKESRDQIEQKLPNKVKDSIIKPPSKVYKCAKIKYKYYNPILNGESTTYMEFGSRQVVGQRRMPQFDADLLFLLHLDKNGLLKIEFQHPIIDCHPAVISGKVGKNVKADIKCYDTWFEATIEKYQKKCGP